VKTLMFAAAATILTSVGALAAWDAGGNTPPNATAINHASGCFEPVEPKADTSREGQMRAVGNPS
jgi:hypothetical protein